MKRLLSILKENLPIGYKSAYTQQYGTFVQLWQAYRVVYCEGRISIWDKCPYITTIYRMYNVSF